MSEASLTVTDAAAEKIHAAKNAEDGRAVALRVTAREAGAKFRYELKLVDAASRNEDDHAVALEGIELYLDPESADQSETHDPAGERQHPGPAVLEELQQVGADPRRFVPQPLDVFEVQVEELEDERLQPIDEGQRPGLCFSHGPRLTRASSSIATRIAAVSSTSPPAFIIT